MKNTIEKQTAWDFVGKYYPNYDSSDAIAYNDDLSKLVNGEQQSGDAATALLNEDYDGDENNPHILIDFNESLVKIYEEAIENFLTITRGNVT